LPPTAVWDEALPSFGGWTLSTIRGYIVFMKYSEDEIVAFARSHIRFVEQQKGKRLVLGFMGAGFLVLVMLLGILVEKASETMEANLFLDVKFIMGTAMGFMLFFVVGLAGLAVVRMFSGFYGKDIEVYRLLVRLKDGTSG
jgi:hypothetical protein